MSIDRLASQIIRQQTKVDTLSEQLEEAQRELGEMHDDYDKAWEETFWRVLRESRLSWCTYCGAVRDPEYLEEAYSLYSKSENYGPSFAHTSTKHRACSQCRPKLKTKAEAAKFGAMFNQDDTDELPNDKTLDELCRRMNIPPQHPEPTNVLARG